MAMNDLLSDMLTRIRNGQNARLASVSCQYSNVLANVLEVLTKEGYISGYTRATANGHPSIDIDLKYYEGKPVIQEIKRMSKPGRREYSAIDALKQFYNGLGTVILSTSKGVLADHEARQQNVGGEVLCCVF